MARFLFEDKLAAVKDYLEGRGSLRSIGNRLGVHNKSILKWITLYKFHGEEGLRSRYTNYPIEFKMDVLNYMNETGASLLDTAGEFNIPSPWTIAQWKRTFEEKGIDALQSKKRGRPSMKKEIKKKQLVEGSQEALLAEIEYLRMENAYLKKLNALVREERKSPNVKRHK